MPAGCRLTPARFGPNYLTVYDVEGLDVGEAVARSGAAMGAAHQAGRLLASLTGGLATA